MIVDFCDFPPCFNPILIPESSFYLEVFYFSLANGGFS